MKTYIFERRERERIFARSEEEALAELAKFHPFDAESGDWELVDVHEHA